MQKKARSGRIEKQNLLRLREDVGEQTRAAGSTEERLSLSIPEEVPLEKSELLDKIRELEDFAVVAAHDLRAPLTNIELAVELLMLKYAHSFEPREKELFQVIEHSVNEMSLFLKSLLALALAETDLTVRKEVKIDEVLDKLLVSLSLKLEQRRTRVVRAPLPTVRIREAIICQVLQNLIVNAIDHAGEAGATIEIGGEMQGDEVHLFVRDNGPGIPEDELLNIFRPFHRENYRNANTNFGIGLAIVYKIARHHNGRAWVVNNPKRGCTFHVTLKDGN